MLPLEQAERILEEIRRNGNRFASQRSGDYLKRRLELETRIRQLFESKGVRTEIDTSTLHDPGSLSLA